MRSTAMALLAATGLVPLMAPLAAQAQPVQPRLVIGAPGTCEMTIASMRMPCTSGLIYVEHNNGTVLVSVQSGPGTTIGFEANGDSQPRRENYRLTLSRLHTSINGQTAAKTVTGTCEIEMSADGQTWHRATCRAADGNNSVTAMTFTGSGGTVTTARPGENPPAGGSAPARPPKG